MKLTDAQRKALETVAKYAPRCPPSRLANRAVVELREAGLVSWCGGGGLVGLELSPFGRRALAEHTPKGPK